MDSHPGLAIDRHPWRAALGFGLATVAFGMVYTTLFMPAITDIRGWWVVPGVWPPIMAARFVVHGALGHMYSADPLIAVGPLSPLVLAPVAAVGEMFKLTDNYRFGVPHPTMWLVYGPYALSFGVLLLYGARALAQRAWVGEGLAGREVSPRHLWTQTAMIGLVLVPAAMVYGHFEDVLTLAFVLLGIRSVVSGRFRPAAWWFGLAIATKQWALLGLPILIGAAPPSARGRTTLRSLFLPGVLMGFVLITNWADAVPALLGPRAVSLFGHAALWVSRSGDILVGSPERLGAVVTATALGWWLRGRTRPRLLLAGFALAFLSRVFFEPVVFAYFLAPALALLFIHERVSARSGMRTAGGGVAILLFFLVHPNAWLWWAVTAAGICWVSLPAVRDLMGRGSPEPAPSEVRPHDVASVDLSSVAS